MAVDGEIAVRPNNLRELLTFYNGTAAGDVVESDECEILLLGFDSVEGCWVGEIEIASQDGTVETLHPRISEEIVRREFRFVLGAQ
jgi:hypothetical protein